MSRQKRRHAGPAAGSVERGSLGLTPEEIDRQEFPIELRGYDRASVAEFLHTVAENYAALLAETRRLLDSSRAPAPAPQAGRPPRPAAPEVSPAVPEEARAIIDAAVELSTRIVAAGHEDRLRSAAEAERIVEAARAQAREYIDQARDYRAVLARAEDDLRRSEETFESDGAVWGAPPRAVPVPRPTNRPAAHLHIAWPPGEAQSPRQAG